MIPGCNKRGFVWERPHNSVKTMTMVGIIHLFRFWRKNPLEVPGTYVRLCLLLLIMVWGCRDVPRSEENSLTEGQRYFLEIALGNEYGSNDPVIHKWTGTIRVAYYQSLPQPLEREFQRIVMEINALSHSITIEVVPEAVEANMLVFVTDPATYAKYEPNAKPYLSENLGLVWVHWDNRSVIYKGSIYVNEDVDTTCQKHLLREEFTQSLGLLNDSYRYPQSIFYQEWTCTTSYTELDREVIGYILDPRITPGMTRDDVIAVFNQMNQSGF